MFNDGDDEDPNGLLLLLYHQLLSIQFSNIGKYFFHRMLESRLRSFKLQAVYVYNKQNVVPCSIHLAPYMLVCCLSLMPQYSSTTLPGFLTSHSPIAFFWLAVTTSLAIILTLDKKGKDSRNGIIKRETRWLPTLTLGGCSSTRFFF